MKNKLILLSIIVLAAALRLYSLGNFPWGLNADEAAIGYNAYSLIQTGHDEHGVAWPLVFRSFDDFKPPVYFYLALPFVKILGLNIWAVRLPSALLGIATVYLTYLLTNLLFGHLRIKNLLGIRNLDLDIGHIAAAMLAISPWHLQYSRGGWEVNASLFFLTLGLWAFFKGLKNQKFSYFWIVNFVVAMYTYHSMRLVVPLLGIYLLISYHKILRNLLLPLVLGIVLLLPLAFQFLGSSGGSARFAGVSIFADQGPLNYVLEMRRTSDNPNSILTKIMYNRYSAYAGNFLKNIALHLSPAFLFISGDPLARNSVPGMGQSYLWTLPFFLIGTFLIFKKINKRTGLILYWFLVGIFPAAITFQSPHALRSENIVVPFMLIISLGIFETFNWLVEHCKLKLCLWAVSCVLVVTAILSLKYYLHQYYIAYPQQLGYAWQPGYDKLAEYIKTNGDKYDKVIISTRYDQPYILMAFFLQYPPLKFQNELVFSTPDQFGFSTGTQFGKYNFHRIDWAKDSKNSNTLIVVADEPFGLGAQPVETIPFPNGDPVFKLYQTK